MHLPIFPTASILPFLIVPFTLLSFAANRQDPVPSRQLPQLLAASETTPNLTIRQFTRTTVDGKPAREGQQVKVGEEVHTSGTTVSRNGVVFGGNALLTMTNWGVDQINLTPNSSATLVSYGKCFGGGRVSQFEVAGKTYITTRKKSHRCSSTIVCMVGSQGCVALNSEVVFSKLEGGKYTIAVREGKAIGQKRLSTTHQTTINADEYSVVTPSGAFSPPKKVTKRPKMRVVTKTGAVQVVEVEEGYKLQVGNRVAQRLQFAVGLTPKIISPLD
jgi:hypothetical protein